MSTGDIATSADHKPVYLFVKRLLDVVLSLVALVVLLPLLVPVAIVLLLTGEHEVLYPQERVGYMNRRFKLIKFVTMLKNSEKLPGGTITVRGDPRVLPIGKLLRKTKINELPQLLNVLKGDMSIVGPRPQTEECFNCFPEHDREKIYWSKPGLTGIGSVVFRMKRKSCTGRDKIIGRSTGIPLCPTKWRWSCGITSIARWSWMRSSSS